MKIFLLLIILSGISFSQESNMGDTTMVTKDPPILYPLAVLYDVIHKHFDSITEERKKELTILASYIQEKLDSGKRINLLFICTHNSRRSQFAQISSLCLAKLHNLPNFHAYSGGTEVTAFNPRAINTLINLGFRVAPPQTQDTNPKVYVNFTYDNKNVQMYSKLYTDVTIPRTDLIAVPVCSQADEACPYIPFAEKRIYLGYEDPKKFDKTIYEAAEYEKTFIDISAELLFAFEQLHIPDFYKK